MINILMKTRAVLKLIIPWTESELQEELDKDYQKLKKDKKRYALKSGFSLEKIEDHIRKILISDDRVNTFKKAKIIIDDERRIKVDFYFYSNTENLWEKSSLSFNKKIILSDKDEEKLRIAPPLEYDFIRDF